MAAAYSFNSDYFSGLDLSIFFGNFMVDDIVNLQYQLSETATPLYDYASYRYKLVARGSRLIQGSFSINFKHSFYIKEVLSKAFGVEQSSERISSTQSVVGLEQPANLPTELTTSDIHAVLEETNRTVRRNRLRDIAGQYSKAFWEKSGSADVVPDTNTPFFVSGRLPIHTRGFTIYLKYLRKVFDYDVIPTITEELKGYVNTTSPYVVEALTGVHLTSVGKAMDDSGKNILEVYNFIGKDLVLGSEPPA